MEFAVLVALAVAITVYVRYGRRLLTRETADKRRELAQVEGQWVSVGYHDGYGMISSYEGFLTAAGQQKGTVTIDPQTGRQFALSISGIRWLTDPATGRERRWPE